MPDTGRRVERPAEMGELCALLCDPAAEDSPLNADVLDSELLVMAVDVLGPAVLEVEAEFEEDTCWKREMAALTLPRGTFAEILGVKPLLPVNLPPETIWDFLGPAPTLTVLFRPVRFRRDGSGLAATGGGAVDGLSDI